MSTMKVIINPDKCKLSGECIKVCPQKAIFVKDGKAVIDYENVTQMACVFRHALRTQSN